MIADGLQTASITPVSEVVGAYDVSIKIAITLKNTLYTDSKITMYFPKWNPDEGDLAFHQVLSDYPLCTAIQNMNPDLLCQYNYDTQYLTIDNGVSETTLGGTEIIFELGNYYNPYSGMPRSGFQIVTTDSVGG